MACGPPIDHEGFHPTTLTVWRNRLRASDRPERIFEAVRAVIAATGVLKGRTRRALDSAVLDDAASEKQVRPLLPGAASCAVLVTSRVRLTGVEGARWIDLDAFASAEAVRLPP